MGGPFRGGRRRSIGDANLELCGPRGHHDADFGANLLAAEGEVVDRRFLPPPQDLFTRAVAINPTLQAEVDGETEG